MHRATYRNICRNASVFMKSIRFYAFLRKHRNHCSVILTVLIIIFGGIGVYLAEYKHPGSNITNLGDAFWWAIVTITTVGYGEYFPLTLIGRVIAVLVMLSGIGIAVIIVTVISKNKVWHMEPRLKLMTEGKRRVLGDETKDEL